MHSSSLHYPWMHDIDEQMDDIQMDQCHIHPFLYCNLLYNTYIFWYILHEFTSIDVNIQNEMRRKQQ